MNNLRNIANREPDAVDKTKSDFNRRVSNFQPTNSILLGLLGYPLGHSVSPILHRVAGEPFGLDINYFPFEVEEDSLGDAVRGLRALGFTGCNVTIPYKEKILKFVDKMSDVVEFLGAANTLSFRGRTIFADNTDWEGFIQGWKDARLCPMEDKKAVILGAGGAAEAVMFALIQSKICEVWIFNRTKERAVDMIEKFREQYPDLQYKAYSIKSPAKLSQALNSADILVNTTPLGMSPNVDEMPINIPKSINPNIHFYDLIYNPQKTKLALELEKIGAKVSGGLGMLVHQAAFAFERWFGLKPDTGEMLKAASKILQRR